MIQTASLPTEWRPRPKPLPLVWIRSVERLQGLRAGSICDPSRLRCFAWPRQALMLAMREVAGLSFAVIAHWLDRDCATVKTGVRAARERRERDPEFAAMCDAICAMVRG